MRAENRRLSCRGTDGSNPAPSSGESGANLSLAGIRLPRSRSPARMIQQLEIETAAGANLMLVQNVEHAPEADAVAVVHARVERNIRLCRSAFGQVLEELHVRRDPECETRIVRPFDDRAINDGRIIEAPRCESH